MTVIFSVYSYRSLLREHPYVCNVIVISVFKALQKHQLTSLHIITTFFSFSHIHVRHIEPKWTCSWARFTLVANRTVNAFAVHWTGRVKITTVQNQTEPGPVKVRPFMFQWYSIRVLLPLAPMADPDILKREWGLGLGLGLGEKPMYQSRRHLANAHNELDPLMRKRRLLKKSWRE